MSIRVGICGLGSMGRNHLRVYNKITEVEVKVTYDPLTSEISEREFLESCRNLDAVSICCPSELHVPMALKILDRNRDIKLLIEKPISTDLDSATLLCDYRDNILVGHIERFNPVVIKLKELYEQGFFGKILSIKTSRMSIEKSRQSSDVATDLLIHDIDVVRYIFGQEIKKPILRYFGTPGSTDYATLTGRVANAATYLEATWLSPVKNRKLEILSEEGLAQIDYIDQTFNFTHITGRKIPIKIINKEPLLEELEHFVGFVSGLTGTACSCIDAIESLRVLEAEKK